MGYELYNEGRVVGLSAYEIYVRQHMSVDPSNPPATEREWLASTLASGESMILKVEKAPYHANDEIWMYEVRLPSGTHLGAANTITGAFFHGDCEFYGAWATKVTDYGEMLANDETSSPTGTTTNMSYLPTRDINRWTDEERSRLLQYGKILDGIIVQPGTWFDASSQPPQKDLAPNLSDYARIRLQIRGPIDTDFSILLTGFVLKAVLLGTAGLDGSVGTENPEDGDFLGPMQFPWAAKINFTIPASYMAYYGSPNYNRTLPLGDEVKTVNETPAIDMQTTRPETYYEKQFQDAREPIDVQSFTKTGEGSSVLTVFQRNEKFPPALWGTFLDETGTHYLNPLDNVAPGTIKLIPNGSAEELAEYEKSFPGTVAMGKTDDGKVYVLDNNREIAIVGGLTIQDAPYDSHISSDRKAKIVITQSGGDKSVLISLSNDLSGKAYTISKLPSQHLSPENDEVVWSALLECLANDRGLDILGSEMKAVKHGLPRNYIQFPNGLRLYCCDKAPTDTDIPVGSLGIGW